MPRIVSKNELLQMVARDLAPSDYFEIDQERINRFADATEDQQFIHVDPERAAKTPFGGTVAHGFLTLSLVPRLLRDISVIPEGTVMTVNYGLNRVRFVQPVRAGSRVRAHLEIVDVEEKNEGRILVREEVMVAIAGQEKPALIAETLLLFMTA